MEASIGDVRPMMLLGAGSIWRWSHGIRVGLIIASGATAKLALTVRLRRHARQQSSCSTWR